MSRKALSHWRVFLPDIREVLAANPLKAALTPADERLLRYTYTATPIPPENPMNDQVFQYTILLRPTHEEAKAGKRAQILFPITEVTARDEREVTLLAARRVPAEYQNCLDRVEVVVRPF